MSKLCMIESRTRPTVPVELQNVIAHIMHMVGALIVCACIQTDLVSKLSVYKYKEEILLFFLTMNSCRHSSVAKYKIKLTKQNCWRTWHIFPLK